MMRRLAFFLILLAGGAPPAKIEKLWVYCAFNLQVDENVPKVEAILARAADAGYTGVLFADFKFNRLDDVPEHYFRNLERVKRRADELKLEFVPCVCPVGYSSGILLHDPNLAEGIPAAAVFEEGRIADDVALANGDFEDRDADRMRGWGFQDAPGEVTFADADAHSGKTSLRMAGVKQNGRIQQKLKVRPHALYHVSVWIKTEGFRGDARINVIAGGRMLNHANLGLKRDQPWTLHHAVFNSMDHDEALLYLGVWGGGEGAIRWDDAKVEPAGLVNVLNRKGAPVEIDGTPAEIKDPRMGAVPWPGEYEVWHAPPAFSEKGRHTISYYTPPIVYDGQVAACPSEPKTHEIIRDQVERVVAALHPPGLMMSHDEIRCLNQDKACRDRTLDAGAILADCVRQCAAICRKAAPKAALYVWSDMFDPNHNARADYYFVRGDLAKSWEGLDKDVVVVNWNFEKRDASLKFFADRGHKQIIAGYYDGKPEQARAWLESAAKVEGVVGIMYTTWEGRYDDLEAFAKAVRDFRP